MEPMFWAGLIVISLAALSYLTYKITGSAEKARKVLFFGAIGWFLWTWSVFFFLSAAIYQFVLIVLAYLGLRKTIASFGALDKEKQELKRALQGCVPDTVLDTVVQEVSKKSLIKNDKHIEEMYRAIENAESVLVISSGWASSSVVNEKFVNAIKGAVERGVSVTLIWGWESSADCSEIPKSRKQALDILIELQKSIDMAMTSGAFHLRRVPQGNHAKVLLVDEKYAVIGSYNYLSNATANRLELSVVCEDSQIVESIKKYFRLCIEKWPETIT